jgi:hypothetical protein
MPSNDLREQLRFVNSLWTRAFGSKVPSSLDPQEVLRSRGGLFECTNTIAMRSELDESKLDRQYWVGQQSGAHAHAERIAERAIDRILVYLNKRRARSNPMRRGSCSDIRSVICFELLKLIVACNRSSDRSIWLVDGLRCFTGGLDNGQTFPSAGGGDTFIIMIRDVKSELDDLHRSLSSALKKKRIRELLASVSRQVTPATPSFTSTPASTARARAYIAASTYAHPNRMLPRGSVVRF